MTKHRNLARMIGIVIGVVLGVWLCGVGLVTVLSGRPTRLGLHEGRLAPCGPAPNAVCSQTDRDRDPAHFVEPIAFKGSPTEAQRRLLAALRQLPGLRIVLVDGPYVHAEAVSRLWRFVDDIECVLDEANSQIHIRSASRLGYSDLGINRDRVERLRQAFSQAE